MSIIPQEDSCGNTSIKMLLLKNGVELPPFPPMYPKVTYGKENGKTYMEVDGHRLRPNKDFAPQRGFQELMMTSMVNLLWVGGVAGPGKTFGGLMKGLYYLDKPNASCLALKRELTEVKTAGGILSDAKKILNDYADFELTTSDSPTFHSKHFNSSFQISHINLQGKAQLREAQEKLKNKQFDYGYVDELTNFNFEIFSYLFSRNRGVSGVGNQLCCSMNANGWHFSYHWLKKAGYIGEDGYIIPDMVGEVTYFVINGKGVEDVIFGKTKQEVLNAMNLDDIPKHIIEEMEQGGYGLDHIPKSFTFIPGKLSDNVILNESNDGSHYSNLFNLGENERRKLLYGNWGEIDQGESRVSREDINRIFEPDNEVSDDQNMYVTADIGGGGDASVAIVWQGLKEIEVLVSFETDAKKRCDWLKGICSKYNIPYEHCAVDANSIGDYLDSYLRGCIGIMYHKRPIIEKDEDGNQIQFSAYKRLGDQLKDKFVAYLHEGKISSGIDPNTKFIHGRTKIERRYVDILQIERNIFVRYQEENGKYYYLPKKEFQREHKVSPDMTDPKYFRMIWELDTTLKKPKDPIYSEEDYYKAFFSAYK